MYRCSRCKEPMRADITAVGIQCHVCGSKVFLKHRPSIKKTIKAR